MQIYVGNLAYAVTDADLRDAFSQFGEVTSASVVVERPSNRSKGFGFVEMSNDNEANAAIEAINGQEIKGRAVRVNQAMPRTERPPRRYA